MPGQHKHDPLQFRPPEALRARLLAHRDETGRPVNAILTRAVTEYLDKVAPSGVPGTEGEQDR
jgi:hypothetical protein